MSSRPTAIPSLWDGRTASTLDERGCSSIARTCPAPISTTVIPDAPQVRSGIQYGGRRAELAPLPQYQVPGSRLHLAREGQVFRVVVNAKARCEGWRPPLQ